MLQYNDSIEELIALPDSQLQSALRSGNFERWVHEYVGYVLSGAGNEDGDYITSDEDLENSFLFSPSNQDFVGKGFSRQRYH